MDEKETFKKITNLFDESKRRRIVDFDKGLLNDVFEPVVGAEPDKFDKWSDRLIRVAARLQNLSKKGKPPKVLNEIYEFFENVKLPYIAPIVKDDSITIKYGRTIRINRGDGGQEMSCPSELFNDTVDKIRQEQFIPLIAKVKSLFAKAMAELEDENFDWHKDDLVDEVVFEGQ